MLDEPEIGRGDGAEQDAHDTRKIGELGGRPYRVGEDPAATPARTAPGAPPDEDGSEKYYTLPRCIWPTAFVTQRALWLADRGTRPPAISERVGPLYTGTGLSSLVRLPGQLAVAQSVPEQRADRRGCWGGSSQFPHSAGLERRQAVQCAVDNVQGTGEQGLGDARARQRDERIVARPLAKYTWDLVEPPRDQDI